MSPHSAAQLLLAVRCGERELYSTEILPDDRPQFVGIAEIQKQGQLHCNW